MQADIIDGEPVVAVRDDGVGMRMRDDGVGMRMRDDSPGAGVGLIIIDKSLLGLTQTTFKTPGGTT